MGLMAWIGARLARSTPVADAALGLVDEVTMQAKSLRQQLEPFQLEKDPFSAIMIKQIMSDTYESGVEFDDTPRAST